MTKTYFLGANSEDGFFSLYDFFPPDGAFLHIIKGGPGGGKSGFMRAIGAEAERRGLDTEYVLCSGDPDSLDGVYIPALNAAWVDGTAPHALEPKIFGVTGDYVNLGRFCRVPTKASADRIADISRSYKKLYAEAYGYISAAGKLSAAAEFQFDALARRIETILRRCPPEDTPRERHIFLRAISCRGLISPESAPDGYGEVYQFTSAFGGSAPALELVRKIAARHGLSALVSMSPLHPRQADTVLLPGCGIAFFGEKYGLKTARHIRLDSLIAEAPSAQRRADAKAAAALERKLLRLAEDKLRAAKALHDELELQYRPHMDFAALTEFTAAEIKKIFA